MLPCASRCAATVFHNSLACLVAASRNGQHFDCTCATFSGIWRISSRSTRGDGFTGDDVGLRSSSSHRSVRDPWQVEHSSAPDDSRDHDWPATSRSRAPYRSNELVARPTDRLASSASWRQLGRHVIPRAGGIKQASAASEPNRHRRPGQAAGISQEPAHQTAAWAMDVDEGSSTWSQSRRRTVSYDDATTKMSYVDPDTRPWKAVAASARHGQHSSDNVSTLGHHRQHERSGRGGGLHVDAEHSGGSREHRLGSRGWDPDRDHRRSAGSRDGRARGGFSDVTPPTHVTSNIIACQSALELRQVLQQHEAVLNHIHVCVALSTAARLATTSAGHGDAATTIPFATQLPHVDADALALMAPLCEVLAEQLPQCSAREMGSCLFSLGRVRYFSRMSPSLLSALLQHLVDPSADVLGSPKAIDLSMIAWALGKLRRQTSSTLAAHNGAFAAGRDEQGVHDSHAQAAEGGDVRRGVLDAEAEVLLHQACVGVMAAARRLPVHDFTPVGISNLLWGLTAAGLRDAEGILNLLAAAQPQVLQASGYNLYSVVEVLLALPPQDQLPPGPLADVLPQLLQAIGDSLITRLPEMDRQMAYIVQAYSQLHYVHTPLFAAVAAHIACAGDRRTLDHYAASPSPALAHLSLLYLASLLRSFNNVHMYDAALYHAATLAARLRLQPGSSSQMGGARNASATPRDIVALVAQFSFAGHYDSQLLREAAAAYLSSPVSPSPADDATLLVHLGRLGFDDSAVVMPLLTRLIQQLSKPDAIGAVNDITRSSPAERSPEVCPLADHPDAGPGSTGGGHSDLHGAAAPSGMPALGDGAHAPLPRSTLCNAALAAAQLGAACEADAAAMATCCQLIEALLAQVQRDHGPINAHFGRSAQAIRLAQQFLTLSRASSLALVSSVDWTDIAVDDEVADSETAAAPQQMVASSGNSAAHADQLAPVTPPVGPRVSSPTASSPVSSPRLMSVAAAGAAEDERVTAGRHAVLEEVRGVLVAAGLKPRLTLGSTTPQVAVDWPQPAAAGSHDGDDGSSSSSSSTDGVTGHTVLFHILSPGHGMLAHQAAAAEDNIASLAADRKRLDSVAGYRLLGSALLRHWLLRRQGHTVVCLLQDQWAACETADHKQALLDSCVARSAAA